MQRVRTVAAVAIAWITGLAALGQGSPSQTRAALYQDPSQPIAARVDDLTGRMTLEEKVQQMMNAAPAIPRLGVPAYDYWSEGLHGVARSGYATMFPQAIGMAATFDPQLIHEMGETVGTEARAKYNDAVRKGIHERYFGPTVWSPNINIFRDPRWGRGQETYGEDPFLTSQMGVAFIRGVQGANAKQPLAVATPKHFAVHSGPESERHTVNVTPSPHDLEDTYLPAFRATVVDGHADSLMCAYNAIDGEPACANTMLLQQTLRGAWGFDGFVTSDCGAIDDFLKEGHNYSPDGEHASASAVLAGTDTECGNRYRSLVKAVDEKLLPESAIDTAVKRLFTARFELGLFDGGIHGAGVGTYGQIGMSENDSAAHRELALKAARESMVLLKNGVERVSQAGVTASSADNRKTLPLEAAHLKTIAVIGPNAASLTALEGNYNAQPSHPVLPVDAIGQTFTGAKVLYAQGSPYAEQVMLPAPRTLFHPVFSGGSSAKEVNGLTAEYFAGTELTGRPAVTRIDSQIDFDWNAAQPLPVLKQDGFAVRWSGTITPPAAGDYDFSFTMGDCDPCGDHEVISMAVDGREVSLSDIPETKRGRPAVLPVFKVHFADTQAHSIRVEYQHKAGVFGAGLTLNWQPPVEALRKQAVAAAKQADVVVAFVGLSSKLEGEEMPVHIQGFAGGDRMNLQLPAVQQQLLTEVSAALEKTGKPLIVVLMNGSALAVNWAQEHANAVLEAWYPGEAGGTAIAETLAGVNNPAGRLPVTFYASIDQVPPFTDYAMKGRTYRYFPGKPLYGFGYGLSYTQFAYEGVTLSAQQLKAGESLTVDASVRNTGSLAGDEVAEMYLLPPENEVNPRLALKGVQRIHLAAGEAKKVHFTLDARSLSLVNAEGVRTVHAGSYSIFVGGSQPPAGSAELKHFRITGELKLPR